MGFFFDSPGMFHEIAWSHAYVGVVGGIGLNDIETFQYLHSGAKRVVSKTVGKERASALAFA